MTAWKDIKDNQLDITGSGSRDEHWPDKPPLSVGERDNVDETCVTVTWLQFNMQLYRLTGEARFAEEIEKTLFNHLLAAQEPRRGADWCYFTPLQGRKPFSAALVCCHSSGPRGIALAPLCLYAATSDGINVNYYTPSTATVPLPSGGSVEISQQTAYPLDGAVTLTLTPKQIAGPFTIRLRSPGVDSQDVGSFERQAGRSHGTSG